MTYSEYLLSIWAVHGVTEAQYNELKLLADMQLAAVKRNCPEYYATAYAMQISTMYLSALPGGAPDFSDNTKIAWVQSDSVNDVTRTYSIKDANPETGNAGSLGMLARIKEMCSMGVGVMLNVSNNCGCRGAKKEADML